MLRHAFIFATLLAAPGAHAYSPEILLEKAAPKVPQVESASSRQWLNPFSSISLGLEHSWEQAHGFITADDNGRVRTRDQKQKANQLSIDVKPKGLFEAFSFHKYEKVLNASTSLEQKILISKSARAAHELLARAALAKEQKLLLADWNVILERSQRLSSITARSEGDAKAVLKAAGEVEKAKAEMAEISGAVEGVTRMLTAYGLKLEELEISGLLTADEIGARAAALSPDSSLSSEDALAESSLERARVKHSEDKNSKWIDGFKFSVQKGNDDILRKRFQPSGSSALVQDETRKSTAYSLGVTVNLPFLAASDLDEQRDRIRLARREMESQIASNEALELTAALRRNVIEKVAAYNSASDSKTTISDQLLHNDPALAMELQRSSMSRRLNRLKLLGEIRALYVELLYETGRLSENAGSQLSRKAGA